MTAELSEDVLGMRGAHADLGETTQALRRRIELATHLRKAHVPHVIRLRLVGPSSAAHVYAQTHFTEVMLKMAQLQTVLQLSAVTLPEIVKGRLGFVQLTQESEREDAAAEKKVREIKNENRGNRRFIHGFMKCLVIRVSAPFCTAPLHSS